MIQVFLFNVLFWYVCDFFFFFFLINWVKYALNQVIQVGLLGSLINKQITHIYSTNTS